MRFGIDTPLDVSGLPEAVLLASEKENTQRRFRGVAMLQPSVIGDHSAIAQSECLHRTVQWFSFALREAKVAHVVSGSDSTAEKEQRRKAAEAEAAKRAEGSLLADLATVTRNTMAMAGKRPSVNVRR